ncbi:transcriptional activator protein [Emilia yellow vein Thailand virus]|uniref:Transcriptional activator protein n=1 Tax=Emilia yellow vein Thailand virus TaxID=2560412 RepID=A0A221C9V6_9GEMI|nr:transcriptional activator protein [Emilia sonchifolia yellow vein Thailand virus]ASL70130.1 transcriptional activator protein [Emilia sonchifolia yellow vein Thailand virus]
MRSSSPSKAHSTQVPIKVQHQIAKKKAVRRRRVDLPCGCSYFIAINCASYGFTHRGTHHCSSSREWRVYLGDNKSPIFQDNPTPGKTISEEPRHNNGSDPVQLQPEESFGDTSMFSNLPNMDSFTSSDLAFLKNI